MRKEPPDVTLEAVLPPNHGYIYFEDGELHPFRPRATTFQAVNAWWLAECALLAYADPDLALGEFRRAGFTVGDDQPLSGESTQCYVLSRDEFVVVAFRGTQVFKPGVHTSLADVVRDVLADISTDAKFGLVRWQRGGSVHRGFRDALNDGDLWRDRLKPLLSELKAEAPERTVWFTGHSLGAALATLAADLFPETQGLYTYGSPLVGDNDFVRTFRPSDNAYRIVNNNDIVCRVPPVGPYEWPGTSVGRYRHVGDLKYISSSSELRDSPGFFERLFGFFRGELRHLIDSAGKLSTQGIAQLPVDSLNDHGPIFYPIHLWNHYEREL